MAELSSEQYEAIGRLTLSFNHLESAFELYTIHVLGVQEWNVGVVIAEEGMFRQKAERFKKVLTTIAKARPILAPQVQSIVILISKAKQLAEKRNMYVHSIVLHDMVTKQPKLRRGDHYVDCDLETIDRLAGNADVLSAQVHLQCNFLLAALEEARSS